ncbi:cadherin-like beta sandwich domain-containing protein, partial [Zongyangia hominis]
MEKKKYASGSGKGRQCLALLLSFMMVLTCIIPASAKELDKNGESNQSALVSPEESSGDNGLYRKPRLAKPAANALGGETLALDGAVIPAGSSALGSAAEGWTIANINDNNFVMFPHKLNDFTLEADVDILDGNWALGLAFGVQNIDSPASEFMATHVNPGRGNTWMFRSSDQVGLNVFGSLAGVDLAQTIHLKLVVEGTNFRFYVNDMDSPNSTGSYPAYAGGYVGLMSALTQTKFTNVTLKDKAESSSPEDPVAEGIIVPEGSDATGNPTDGYILNYLNRNNFAVFDTYAETLSFETDVEFLSESARAGGILFGVNDPNTVDTWSAVHLEAYSGNLRIFSDYGGIDQSAALPGVDLTQKNRLKLTIDEQNNVSIFVNDMDHPVLTAKYPSYRGGYVGFNCSLSQTKFSNYKITAGLVPEPELKATGLGKASGGAFSENGEGYVQQRTEEENITLFEPKVTAFDYTGTVELREAGEGAFAGLVFGDRQMKNPRAKWGAVELIPGEKKIRVVYNRITLKESEPLEDVDFNQPVELRVKIGAKNVLDVYVNGSADPVLSVGCETYNGGYVGFISRNGQASFEKLSLSALAEPRLDSLEVDGVPVDFNPDELMYLVHVGADTASVKVKATAPEGMAISIRGTPVESGVESGPIPVSGGHNAILISVTSDKYETVYNAAVYKELDQETLYEEPFRPRFHYSAAQNWINDPNGLSYNPHTGEYHMFYQYNPFGGGWGNMSWGHAVSKDLVHWKEMPVALYADEFGNMSSGSCVIDEKNTSGLFDESTPPDSRMVALFTHNSEFPCPGGIGPGVQDTVGGRQEQYLAYSKDGGTTWIQYEGNPVLPNEGYATYGNDFRDPKILWIEDESYDSGGIWLMVVAGGYARLYTSPDLIHWTFNSDIQDAAGNRIWTECPDLFQLPVDGGTDKWVYVGYVSPDEWYYVGELTKQDGVFHFRSETEKQSGNGGFVYATQSYYNDPQGRRILVSWLNDGSYGLPGKTWTGMQSIPMETKLVSYQDGYKMTSYPVEELKSLRLPDPLFTTENQTVSEGDENILKDVQGAFYDVEAVIDPGTATAFGLKLRVNGDQTLIVKYDTAKQTMDFHSATLDRSLSMIPMDDGKVKLRVLVDSYVVDAFGNDGITALTGLFVPDLNNMNDDGMEFYVEGGDVTVDSLNIYAMDSSWKEPSPQPVPTVLTDLTLSSALLTPQFSADVTEYTATVANSVDSIKVLPTYTGDAAVTVNGTEVTSGAYSADISLNVGENAITVVAGEKTYTIKITREKPAPVPTVLTGLALSTGTLAPNFSTEATEYTATVANSVDSIKVLPAYTGDTAVTVNGTEVASGAYSAGISLSVGENTITVVAGEKTYTIKVTREDKKPPVTETPFLDGLELSQGVLQPSFDKDVNAYSASVTNSVDSIQVKPFYSGEMAVTV